MPYPQYKKKLVKTRYWSPGDDYIALIVNSIKGIVDDGDVVAISEKAIATAKGQLIDESKVKPSSLARVLAKYWMRTIWGQLLGKIARLKPEAVRHLKNYPTEEGAAHKQVTLKYAGFIQALQSGSEGGIDISNMPFAFACLPLTNPEEEADQILREVKKRLGKNVTVIIVDTDSTFSFSNFYFTARPSPIEGIKSFGGVLSFLFGRGLKLRQRATPLAVAGSSLTVEEALDLAELAHHTRGYGSGRTVWDMANNFETGFTGVTWKMLRQVEHGPIVLIRRK